MTITEAAAMIRLPAPSTLPAGRWADLGCGAGTFTLGLASLLPAGSEIAAVDADAAALRRIPSAQNGVRIVPVTADLTDYARDLRQLDGIIMANALHFVRDQESLLRSLKNALRPGGLLLLVEYDLTMASRWVPFPVAPATAEKMLQHSGFTGFHPLQRRPSAYGPQFLYSAYTHA